jgi:uncharacterized membrane protein YdbT with pleckstrin-like domain
MASYVDSVLREGETVTHRGHIHWIVYVPAVFWAAVAIALLFVTGVLSGRISVDDNLSLIGMIFGGLASLMAFWYWVRAFILRWSTELVTTTMRVIVKVGLVRRHTWEINAGKVEGVEVNQSIPGRILNYGTVIVKGTGSGSAPVRFVGQPIEFRNHVMAL